MVTDHAYLVPWQMPLRASEQGKQTKLRSLLTLSNTTSYNSIQPVQEILQSNITNKVRDQPPPLFGSPSINDLPPEQTLPLPRQTPTTTVPPPPIFHKA
jgi:hypothetical protein